MNHNREDANRYVAAEMTNYTEEQKYDFAAKKFLASKDIMSAILEELDFLPKGYDREKIQNSFIGSTGDPEAPYIPLKPSENIAPSGKIIYDLRFDLELPEDEKLLVDVEAQHNFNSLQVFVGRASYYGSRLISGQKNITFEGTNYGDLCPTCSIWLCQDAPKEWQNKVVYSKEREYVTHTGEPFDFGGLAKDYFREIYVFMADMEIIEEKRPQDKLINFLNVAMSDHATEEERLEAMERNGIPVTNYTKGALNEMFELGSGIYNRGEAKGQTKGVAIMVDRFMRRTGYSFRDSCEFFGVPESERRDILEELNKETHKENGEEKDESDKEKPPPQRYSEHISVTSTAVDLKTVGSGEVKIKEGPQDSPAVSPLEDRTPSYGGVSGYQEFRREMNRGSEKNKSKGRDEGR